MQPPYFLRRGFPPSGTCGEGNKAAALEASRKDIQRERKCYTKWVADRSAGSLLLTSLARTPLDLKINPARLTAPACKPSRLKFVERYRAVGSFWKLCELV